MKYTFAFLAIAFSSLALNAENRADSIKTNKINEVTVLGGLSGSFALPMAVVNKSTIEKNSFYTPADALRRETGISLSRDGIWATSVNVRGLSEQRLLLLVDGDRIQTSSDIAGALSTVDMASLEKIEVIKGASSVLYGSGAMGGIINFVSERPTYSKTFQTFGKISSGFNTANNLWANSANINFTTNQWYIALNGSYRTAENTQSPKGEILSSQFHDASWGLKGGMQYSRSEELLVNFQHTGAWDVGLPGVSSFPAIAEARYKKVNRNQLSGEYIISDINDYLTKLSIKIYTQNITREVESTLKPQSTVLLPSSTNSTSGAKITSDWLLTVRQSLVLGAEGWLRKSETERLRIISPTATKDSVRGEQPVANARMLDIGVFAHYSWKVIPTKLILNAGVRLDYIRTMNDSAFNPVFIYTVNDGVRKNITGFSRSTLFEAGTSTEMAYAAHFDAFYNLTKKQSVSLSIANSYRAASIDERFKYIDLGAAKKVGNPDLKPEHGTFANFNYTISSSKLLVKADVFANYLIDLITEVQTSATSKIFMNTNIDKALFLGGELEANWNINRHFSVLANASYTNTQNLETNTPLPQIPPMTGFASLNYRSGKLLVASFSTLWVASQNEVAVGETKTAGHIVYNIDAHSTPINLGNTYLQLFAGVDNMMNTAYYNHLTSVRGGGTKYYEPGRNIYVKAKFGF